MIDLDLLDRLAKEATLGEMRFERGEPLPSDSARRYYGTVSVDGKRGFVANFGSETVDGCDANGSFIAAANPAAVRELIERVRKAEAARCERRELTPEMTERIKAFSLETIQKLYIECLGDNIETCEACDELEDANAALKARVEAMRGVLEAARKEVVSWQMGTRRAIAALDAKKEDGQ